MSKLLSIEMPMKLVINPEYEKLVPDIEKNELDELRTSIKQNDLWVPIIINRENEILDGHHRFKICNELGKEIKTELGPIFESKLHEKLFVIDCNLKRRQLAMVDKAALAFKRLQIETEINKIKQIQTRQVSTGAKKLAPVKKRNYKKEETNRKISPEQNKKKKTNKSTTRAARSQAISDTTLEQYQSVLKNADAETIDKMNKKWLTIGKAYKLTKKHQAVQKLLNEKPILQLPKNFTPYCGDCLVESNKYIPDNSVDLIFTDPPYQGSNTEETYTKLGQIAQRVLKPGGSLVVYIGTWNLLEHSKILEKSGLKYYWIFCVKHSGAHTQMFQRQVIPNWKPLMWFIKGDKLMGGLTSIQDYIQSSQPTQNEHKWQQSVVEAEHIIKGLTVENKIVLDPFMGSGTTGIAALNLKRQFIGIEDDKEIFKIAESMIAKEVKQ